jgi:hypothetical protein
MPFRTFFPLPRRLEGYAFQAAWKKLVGGPPRRKGEAFPHSKRRSRTLPLSQRIVIWTSLHGHAPLPCSLVVIDGLGGVISADCWLVFDSTESPIIPLIRMAGK